VERVHALLLKEGLAAVELAELGPGSLWVVWCVTREVRRGTAILRVEVLAVDDCVLVVVLIQGAVRGLVEQFLAAIIERRRVGVVVGLPAGAFLVLPVD